MCYTLISRYNFRTGTEFTITSTIMCYKFTANSSNAILSLILLNFLSFSKLDY